MVQLVGKMMKLLRLVFVLAAVLALQGCSKRALYDGFQMVRERQCYDLQGSQREDCLKNADTSYGQYQMDRQETSGKESK